MDNDKLTTAIAFSGSPLDAGFVKSLLENAGIQAFLKDENMGTIAPWYASPGGAGAVKVMINSQDSERAKEIVDQFEKGRNGG